jgi:hypothetical protein
VIHNEVLKSLKANNCFGDKSIEIRISSMNIFTAIANNSNNFTFMEGKSGSLAICLKVYFI